MSELCINMKGVRKQPEDIRSNVTVLKKKVSEISSIKQAINLDSSTEIIKENLENVASALENQYISMSSLADGLDEIIKIYQQTEVKISSNKIAQNEMMNSSGSEDSTDNENVISEAFDKIKDLIEQYIQGKIDLLSLLSNVASILEYIGKDAAAMDDLAKLVGLQNADDFVKFGKEVGESELGSLLSLFARAYENGSAVIDGEIRWDQGLRYFGLELLGDLGKDAAIGVTGVYGFAAFALIDAYCIINYGEDAVGALAHTIDDNTFEAWYQSW